MGHVPIAGTGDNDPAIETNEYWYNQRIFVSKGYEQDKREKCNSIDIDMATTTLLGQFVKAHADVLMGRGGRKSSHTA